MSNHPGNPTDSNWRYSSSSQRHDVPKYLQRDRASSSIKNATTHTPSSSLSSTHKQQQRNERFNVQSTNAGDWSIQKEGFRVSERNDLTSQFNRDEMKLLDSPSRGETTNMKSLLNHSVQGQYRAYVQEKIDRLLAIHPNILEDPPLKLSKDVNEQLSLILLDLRKLREGIIASSRQDEFSLEVYVMSVKLAIISSDLPQLASSLPTLIFSIYPTLPKHVRDKRKDYEFYISLWLLHLICNSDQLTKFCTDLRDLSCEPSLLNSRLPLNHLQISLLHPHILLARQVFNAIVSRNFVAIQHILQLPTYAYDTSSSSKTIIHPLQRIIISRIIPRMRQTTWNIISRAYLSIKDEETIARMLAIAGPNDRVPNHLDTSTTLTDFLTTKNMVKRVDDDACVIFKRR